MDIRLAREEDLFSGTSPGGNVIAGLRLAEQLGTDATIGKIIDLTEVAGRDFG